MSILQGQGVGGSTVINNTIWIRPDLDRVLPKWAERGAHVDRPALTRAYPELEAWLRMAPIPADMQTPGTTLFTQGCAQLGITCQILSHNRDTCTGCGWRNYGCKYNRKLSGLVTFVPWAETLGAQFLDHCEEISLRQQSRHIPEVTFTHNGQQQRVAPGRVVVSCGAIGSSALMLRNDINPGGRVGKNFHLLGGVMVTALSPTPLDALRQDWARRLHLLATDRKFKSTFRAPLASVPPTGVPSRPPPPQTPRERRVGACWGSLWATCTGWGSLAV